jgi:hypothetical protein
VYLLNRLPTKTVPGYMSPHECVTGTPLNLKWLRIWGCKCYALKPVAERWKDFDDEAYSGILVGYAQENTGYLIYIQAVDKIIVSVHVIFNEIIPDPTAEYFSELEKLKIEGASDAKDPADYSFLVGTQHLDDEDGLLYETTRVVVQKGVIVAYRRLVTSAGVKPREETTPIHIADVARMTATLQCPSPEDSVQRALETPRNDTPGPQRQVDISLNPNRRRFEAPLEVPSSSSALPIWNSQGRLATSTPAAKRRRLSQGLELRTNLASEFQTPPQRGRHKSRSHINVIFLLCLHMSCPQSYVSCPCPQVS